MTIKKAEFISSASKVTQCPPPDKHEYAFIGRSNVGKSSLINMLTGYSTLAKISQNPGKTQVINHFLINGSWYMVDLPGYGYARVGLSQRSVFSKMIKDYILQRQNLVSLLVLVDSRLKPQKIDLEFMTWLGENGVPFAIVFTKIDKLSSIERAKVVPAYKKVMLETWSEMPPHILTSAETKAGKTELLAYIGALNKEPLETLIG